MSLSLSFWFSTLTVESHKGSSTPVIIIIIIVVIIIIIVMIIIVIIIIVKIIIIIIIVVIVVINPCDRKNRKKLMDLYFKHDSRLMNLKLCYF